MNVIKSYIQCTLSNIVKTGSEQTEQISLQMLRECSSWHLELVQLNFFSDTSQKHLCWKICKMSKVFGCVVEVCFL